MSRVPFSPARVALIAHNTLLEAARQRLFLVLLLLALGLVIGARWLRDFNFGTPELKFLADCGFGAMAFFGPAVVIAATAQLFFGEIENRTALTLLAKPVWRAEFLLGKFFGVVALAGIFCALLTTVLAAVLWTRESELMRLLPEAFPQGRTIRPSAVFVAGAMQCLKLSVLGALTLLVASYAQTQLFTVVAGFFILVICHLQYLAQDAYARGGATIGRVTGKILALTFPNFQVFNFAEPHLTSGTLPWSHLARVVPYGLCYIVAALALAVICFRQREI
jgi:ABC-type transport system involved in multi-copper enzyme maturation permease subunit